MFCKNCGTKNEPDMTFCQNCGESIKSAPALTAAAPIGKTIKVVGNLIFGLMIAIGSILIIVGIALIDVFDSAIPIIIGLAAGAITMVIGYIARAFTYGYGIIVSYCERRDNE
jgi:hypothetical protein